MASKIDVSALSLNAKEAESVSEAVFEKMFVDTQLAQIHDIVTGVSMKEQIVFIANLAIGGEALTGCTPAEQDTLVLTEKFWEPVLIAGRFKHCAADLNQLLKIFRRAQKATPDFFDRIGSEEISILVARIIDAVMRSINAKIWFAAKNAAVQPGGDFTIVGFNAGLWDQFDGLFEQIFADSAVKVTVISENANATFALQALAADKALTTFRSMYADADTRLLQDPDVQLLVTRTMWENYLVSTEDKEFNGGITRRLDNGQISMDFRSIPIVMMDSWDRNIDEFQNDLTVHVLPHRALLTVPSNIPVATLSESDFDTMDSFYDRTDKQNIVDYAYFLDAKHGESYLTVAAY
ncbi:MAG: hypothetical protein JKY98_03900 [Gammaproteobacteria bacterium]|nr:hypothetical protein [Gammaproteobacteria bacterium]